MSLLNVSATGLYLASTRLERLFANFTAADNSSSFPRLLVGLNLLQ